jgi:hypothetical protein
MAKPYTLLGMLALLPLLESIDALISFAQRRDVFVCDFIGALERCKLQLFTYYKNSDTKFNRDDFHAFNQFLSGSHESILLKWDTNLNLPCEQLAYVFGTEQVFAVHDGSPVTREVWAALVEDIKANVTGNVFQS